MKRLYDRLAEYEHSDFYGFHMPGHKRNAAFMGIDLPYGLDITEIDGFDDLHHADGILKEAQERAARVFGAEETHFLINGSTAGILCSILGCTQKGDGILISRHCHKSVYHAIFLKELRPYYVYPEFDGSRHMNGEIRAEDIRKMLEMHPDIKAVVIVSPNYDGVVSDVRGIAKIVHEKGILLIVDEAHGPHFGFSEYFPDPANALGADVVINSLHKTLPSLTQTALLHINGTYADRAGIRKYLDMLQSSSPSYLLMASLDACVDMLETHGKKEFERYTKSLEKLRQALGKMKHLKLLELEHYDRSKLVISVADSDMTSIELYRKLLNDYHLQMEMVAGTYVLAMTSVADTQEGLNRLETALLEIDEKLGAGSEAEKVISGELPHQEQVFAPFELEEEKKRSGEEMLPWKDSIGRISTEYAYLYPPGSPIIVPGERIKEEAVQLFTFYKEQHFQIEGMQKEGYIRVLKNG